VPAFPVFLENPGLRFPALLQNIVTNDQPRARAAEPCQQIEQSFCVRAVNKGFYHERKVYRFRAKNGTIQRLIHEIPMSDPATLLYARRLCGQIVLCNALLNAAVGYPGESPVGPAGKVDNTASHSASKIKDGS